MLSHNLLREYGAFTERCASRVHYSPFVDFKLHIVNSLALGSGNIINCSCRRSIKMNVESVMAGRDSAAEVS